MSRGDTRSCSTGSGSRPQADADGGALTHLGAQGEANMVDVGDKDETERTAIAEGSVIDAARDAAD